MHEAQDEAHTGTSDDATGMEIDIQFVDSLPGGRAVMSLECDGTFVWLVARKHMSPEARQEMLNSLRHIVRSGLWQQNWPPQAKS